MTDTLLAETARRVMSDLCTPDLRRIGEEGRFSTAAWAVLAEVGLPLVNAPEARGGVGAGPAEVAEVLRAAGFHALPLPLAEVLLAEAALAAAGLSPSEAPLTVAPALAGQSLAARRAGGGWVASGRLDLVPWGRHLDLVAVAETPEGPLTLVLPRPEGIAPGMNLANEPRDRLVFRDTPARAAGTPGAGCSTAGLRLLGALFRTVQTVGVMERIRDLTVAYSTERQQFGRPIARFQAVQQQVAVLAAQVAACQAAADGAVEAAAGGPAAFEIAAAKAVTGEAAGLIAGIAHQVHGAMGFTHEYPLHLSTRRIWSWREDFGTEAEWQGWLGRNARAVGGAALWPFLTARGKAPPVPLES